mmetsp:Transcript_29903/g.86977  ORF Transcript_29903/g.86977 Transcript_29903/m.86977 type:complete len:369 (-) Transcript_29903:246-1352(-)
MMSARALLACLAAVCIDVALSMRQLERDRRIHCEDLDGALQRLDKHFKLVADLGFFSWYPICSAAEPHMQRVCNSDLGFEELRRGLGVEEGPPCGWRLPEAFPARLVDIKELRSRLPLGLFGSTPSGSDTRLPHVPPPVGALFAASKSHDLSRIDFFIGESVLYTLATGALHGRGYSVQAWRDIILIFPSHDHIVHRDKEYERLLTTVENAAPRGEARHTQHLQILGIGKYNVLVEAEVSALDENRRPVELGTVVRPNWEQTIFRMVSAGATEFFHGVTERNALKEIHEYNLHHLLGMFSGAERTALATNITGALKSIRKKVGKAKAVYGLGGWDAKSSPTLHRLVDPAESLLPGPAVMEELFPAVSG